MCEPRHFNTCLSRSPKFFLYLTPFNSQKRLVTSLVYAPINEWREPIATLFCLINVVYHLELRIAITFLLKVSFFVQIT